MAEMYLKNAYQTTEFQLLARLFEVSNRIQTKGDAQFQECSTKQWYLLCYVAGFQPKSPTLNELATNMGTSHQNTRQMVKRLEERGFLRTMADETDRRKLRICLTEKTELLWQKYQSISDSFVKRLFLDCTVEELERARVALEKMNQFLRI